MDATSTLLQSLFSAADAEALIDRVSVSDQERMARWLERMIRRRTGGRVVEVHVEIQPTGVVLQGRSRSYYGKQLAQHAVMELVGREPIQNHIHVD